jgi:hypothetical protein
MAKIKFTHRSVGSAPCGAFALSDDMYCDIRPSTRTYTVMVNHVIPFTDPLLAGAYTLLYTVRHASVR